MKIKAFNIKKIIKCLLISTGVILVIPGVLWNSFPAARIRILLPHQAS